MEKSAYIFDCLRTPRGRRKKGALNEVTPIKLLAGLMKEIERRHKLDTSEIDDVVIGCVTPVGEQGSNIAKMATQFAGWDLDVPAMQVNRFCATGLETINLAAMKVLSGWEELVVAGGVECMSRVPMGLDGGPMSSDPKVSFKTPFIPQGIGADLIATIEKFSRRDVDKYALESQKKAYKARVEGKFKSIIPVFDQNGLLILDHDEHIRPETTFRDLEDLKPSFEKIGLLGMDSVALQSYPHIDSIKHVHTPGNSSGIVDGAALALIGSIEKGKELGLRPRAKILSSALVGTDPIIMLTGPGPATKKALKKAKMNISDIDLLEVNEAFASVVLRFARDLNLNNLDNVNVNGGSIALGHPLGATGSMLMGTLIDELEERNLQTGLVTLCVGGGMGIATIIERV